MQPPGLRNVSQRFWYDSTNLVRILINWFWFVRKPKFKRRRKNEGLGFLWTATEDKAMGSAETYRFIGK